MQALTRAVFESWVVNHLTEFFPGKIKGLSATEIRSRIRGG